MAVKGLNNKYVVIIIFVIIQNFVNLSDLKVMEGQLRGLLDHVAQIIRSLKNSSSQMSQEPQCWHSLQSFPSHTCPKLLSRLFVRLNLNGLILAHRTTSDCETVSVVKSRRLAPEHTYFAFSAWADSTPHGLLICLCAEIVQLTLLDVSIDN